MFKIETVSLTRTIHVLSSGIWSMAEADRYVAQFDFAVRAARRNFGNVKVLVDARDASPPPPEVAVRLAYLGKLFRPGDRMAIVLPNSVRKQQTRGSLPSAGTPFLSIEAAQTWLAAYDEISK